MVRTRFAPSPTGYLHIGGVRTALYNWLFARHHQGQFLLRIDDTDQGRNNAAALQPILDGFRWLGLDWDEGPEVGGPHGPYFQSERTERYQAAVRELLARGKAYRDYARPEEVKAEREAAEAEKRPFRASRNWAAETDADAQRFEAEGRTSVVRLKMPHEGHCRFRDLIRGELEFSWAEEQDHVIQRADGSCLYNLANVVDDYEMEITHVIRAIEHLPNTPRQIFIAQSLGYPLPHYAHLPYVAEPGSKQKLSKRKIPQYLKNVEFKKLYEHAMRIADILQWKTSAETFNPVLVDFYKAVGYLPDAILNYLLLVGWSLDDKTEDFTRAEMIQHFSLERVTQSAASFDPAKLWAFQARRFAQLPVKQKVPLVLSFVQQAGWVTTPAPCEIGPFLTKLVTAAGDRLKVAGDVLDYADFFVAEDQLSYEEKAFEKRLRQAPEAASILRRYQAAVATVSPFEASTLDQHLQQFVQSGGMEMGQLVHALRVALTGKSIGFGLGDIQELLGPARVQARIARALARVEAISEPRPA